MVKQDTRPEDLCAELRDSAEYWKPYVFARVFDKAADRIEQLQARLDAVEKTPSYCWADVSRNGARLDTRWIRADELDKALKGGSE